MLNRPWIDPRDRDWTDPYNPLTNPGFNHNNNPFVATALDDQFMYAIRQAKGLEPRVYVGPDPNNQMLAAGTTQDYEVPTEPNFWCWAITASGNPVLDFLVNVTDSVTGAIIFSQPCSAAAINAARNGTSGRGPLFFLSTPHLFTPPSYPVIRVINTAASAQVIRVCLWGAVEYDK